MDFRVPDSTTKIARWTFYDDKTVKAQFTIKR